MKSRDAIRPEPVTSGVQARLGLMGLACMVGDYWRQQVFHPSPCGNWRVLSGLPATPRGMYAG